MRRPYSATEQNKSRTRGRIDCAEVCEEGVVEAGEGAAAKDDGADGAGGFVVGDAHLAAARIFLDGHFGDDRNAHSGANHAEDAAELATLENDLRIEAGTIARGYRGVAKAVTIAQQQERLLAEILERKRTAAGERVLSWKRGEEAFGEEWKGVELVAANR